MLLCHLAPDLDGDQILDFYFIDPVASMDRFIGQPKFASKTYFKYERQESELRPNKRAFGRANSGLVFQEAQLLDMYSVPLLHLFYGDKSFSGMHGTHYPIYREDTSHCCLYCINQISYINCINYIKCSTRSPMCIIV